MYKTEKKKLQRKTTKNYYPVFSPEIYLFRKHTFLIHFSKKKHGGRLSHKWNIVAKVGAQQQMSMHDDKSRQHNDKG